MLITCADVAMRYLGLQVAGAYELVGFFGAIAAAFSMAHAAIHKKHISVDFITRKLPQKLQNIISFFTNILGLVFFYFISRQLWIYAESMKNSGEISLTLQFKFYYFIYGSSVASFLVCLVILLNILKLFLKQKAC